MLAIQVAMPNDECLTFKCVVESPSLIIVCDDDDDDFFDLRDHHES
jgi:hypothetical protein